MIYKHKFYSAFLSMVSLEKWKLSIGTDSLVDFLCRFKICDFGSKTMCQ